MLYLTGVHSAKIAAYAATEPRLGLMAQPRSAVLDAIPLYAPGYAFDNGAFGAFLRGTPFDARAWARQLDRLPVASCLFAVVPDAVGDHAGTVSMWDEHLAAVSTRHLPPAFVLQNGCTDLSQVPTSAHAVFIGGDDAYKLGPDAARVCWQAQRAGLWVHMGRVNSGKRWLRALAMGCDSADGTFLRFGPQDRMLAQVGAWLAAGDRRGANLDLLDAVAR